MDNTELNNRFDYHPPKDEQTIKKHELIRATSRLLAVMISEACPPSREQSLALTKVEEAMLWANAAIARN